LDEHYKQNKRKKKKKIADNIGNFLSYNEWVDGHAEREVQEIQENNENKGKELQVVYNDENKTCDVCGEVFDVCWNKQINEWVFRNAVMVNEDNDDGKNLNKIIMHESCYQVLEKQAANLQQEEKNRNNLLYIGGMQEKWLNQVSSVAVGN